MNHLSRAGAGKPHATSVGTGGGRPLRLPGLGNGNVPQPPDDRYQANQARLRANAARMRGPVRAGSALLSGLLVCGRCGLRMTSAYNNNGRAARYLCGTMKSVYDAPLCQSLTAAPLDALIAELVLEAVRPAALEVSLAVAADFEAERAALERHWQQRLERARYEVDRARRQYNAVEPENRLVARTHERAWEEALAEQTRLEAEHERHWREREAAPVPEELRTIRAMAQDLPALWRAETTTQEERQTIVRLLVERILVEIIDGSEQVRIECHWQGGACVNEPWPTLLTNVGSPWLYWRLTPDAARPSSPHGLLGPCRRRRGGRVAEQHSAHEAAPRFARLRLKR